MEIPNDEQLLNKTKDELDKIKVALEISSFKETQSFEKRKYRGETIRLFIISIVTAAISLGTTYLFKDYDHSSAQTDHAEYELEGFKQNLITSTNFDDQKNYICKIANIIIPSGSKALQQTITLYGIKCDSMKNLEIDKLSLDKTIRSIKDVDTNGISGQKTINILDKADAQLIKLQNTQYNKSQADVNANLKQVQNVNQYVNNDNSIDPALKTAIQSSSAINKNILEQIKLVSNGNSTNDRFLKTYDVQWFKKGYSIQFDNINLTLLDYNKGGGSITVKVCRANISLKCDSTITSQAEVYLNTPYNFSFDNKNYELSLKAIDHAGKNPFTLAAYVSLAIKKN